MFMLASCRFLLFYVFLLYCWFAVSDERLGLIIKRKKEKRWLEVYTIVAMATWGSSPELVIDIRSCDNEAYELAGCHSNWENVIVAC